MSTKYFYSYLESLKESHPMSKMSPWFVLEMHFQKRVSKLPIVCVQHTQ